MYQLSIITIIIIIGSVQLIDSHRPFWYDRSCPIDTDGCHCLSRTKTKCCCVGESVTSISRNFTANLKILLLGNVAIETISADDLALYPHLEQIEIIGAHSLVSIDARAFDQLVGLRKISIDDCGQLKEIEGTLLEKNHKMLSLSVTNTGLERMPNMRMSDEHLLPMNLIDFSHNRIKYLGDQRLQRIYAKTLRLNNNRLLDIGGRAFSNCKFVNLHLSDNRDLTTMSIDTFDQISELHHLDLSNTGISELPTKGISNLKAITLRNTHSLKQLPSILAFTNLVTAHFTYPYHCCLFKYANKEMNKVTGRNFRGNLNELKAKYCRVKQQPTIPTRIRRSLQQPIDSMLSDIHESDNLIELLERLSELESEYDINRTWSFGEPFAQPATNVGKTIVYECDSHIEEYYDNITCTPQPDALNPCEDIIGFIFLRFAIWIVWICSIIGNVGVWIVLIIFRHPRMRVHYFFMMNLSFADLLSGFYLAILSIADIRTSNEYYNHAVEWQTGAGCKFAGFLSIFASELSIITMFLISFEIWYNTKFILYGRRLSERVAYALQTIAYIFAITMASLPLIGVSNYSSNSVCLPLDIDAPIARVYIITGLLFNVIAFIGMATNYGMIYCSVNESGRPLRPEDMHVAKKMAVLIATDFVCWAPAILFGLTAALHLPLISISVAKIFLVLFYPINACFNPFLYVFFSKVIKTDMKNIVDSAIFSWWTHQGSNGGGGTVDKSHRPSPSLTHYFYHSRPPRDRNLSEGGNLGGAYLHVTQMTSLESSPRGSNCSSSNNHRNTNSSASSLDVLLKSSSTESRNNVEAEMVVPILKLTDRRKSLPLKTIARVSATPQMSDISEHSSDDSNGRNRSNGGDSFRHRPIIDRVMSWTKRKERPVPIVYDAAVATAASACIADRRQSQISAESGYIDDVSTPDIRTTPTRLSMSDEVSSRSPSTSQTLLKTTLMVAPQLVVSDFSEIDR